MSNLIQVTNTKFKGTDYNIFYKEAFVCNVTVSSSVIMTNDMALEILNDILKQNGLVPRKYVSKIRFEIA